MAWLLGSALALAGVQVTDEQDCVDQERVVLEVGRVLDGLQAPDVDVSVTMSSDVLGLVVHRQSRVIWAREVPVLAADCPVVPDLVARSLEQGLSGLPDWQFGAEKGLPPDIGVFLEGSFSPVPTPLGWGVVGLGSGPLGRSGRWVVGVSLSAVSVGDGRGRGAQLLTPQVRLGPGTDLGRQRRWRWIASLSAGPVFVVPRADLALSGPRWVPGARAEMALQWRGEGALAVAAFVDSPIVRVVVVDDSVPQRLPEGLVRVGVRVGVAGSLREE